jgi:hypothetical protein
MYIRCPCKVPVILVIHYCNLNFRDKFSKNTENIKFHENPYSGAELLHVDGQTEMTKLIVAFRNFSNVPKN